MKSRCFTLIELLVVVAIIAVLVAILLPALNAAREQGKSAVCQANLRQLGMVFRYYAEDHNDFIASYAAQGNGCRWYDLLAGYRETQNRSKNKNIYLCPAQKAVVCEGDGTEITNYAQSEALACEFWYSKWAKGDYVGCWSPPFRFAAIVEPTRKILLIDTGVHTIPVVETTQGHYGYQNLIPELHNHGDNALYIDGHAEWGSTVSFIDPNEIAKFFPDR